LSRAAARLVVLANAAGCAGLIGIHEPIEDAGEAAPAPPSCRAGGPGADDCGPHADESCCASPIVEGGTFLRSYDGATYGSQSDPAAVTTLRLDRFEITVGRFRAFVAAVLQGWLPAAGSGKHENVNGGRGLNGGGESGWDASWNADLTATPGDWSSALACSATWQTWTPAPAAGEGLPINCITWYEAYAFCIWDGGFLPSEAEWNYAGAGGAEQRAYPWSSPPSSQAIACNDANYQNAGCGSGPWKGGTASPAGDGRWSQADLAGNLQEWVLDSYAPGYVDPCADCAALAPGPLRMNRGGAFGDVASLLSVSRRGYDAPSRRTYTLGARCARAALTSP
jgi:formylglycine-generating enzyme required for sulfatase activity